MTHIMILEDDGASMEALKKILMEYSGDVCVHAASSYDEAKRLLDADWAEKTGKISAVSYLPESFAASSGIHLLL